MLASRGVEPTPPDSAEQNSRPGAPDGAPTDPSRRRWGRMAFGWSVVAASLGTGWLMVRAWLPWITRRPDGRWSLGPASRFPKGSAVLLRRANAVIVHDELGLHAMSAICTHQRCTVRDTPARNELTCPCHGAAFSYDGEPLRGPTRVPLPWLALEEEGGELVLDPDRRVPRGSV